MSAGKTLLRKQLKRGEVLKFFANLPVCLIGMEACGSAHYWARKLIELGHTVKLMAPSFVKPYVKTNKNDRNDAEAICEAVTRPNMRFVPIKSAEQQAAAGAALCALGLGEGQNSAGQPDPRFARLSSGSSCPRASRGYAARYPSCWRMRAMACPG